MSPSRPENDSNHRDGVRNQALIRELNDQVFAFAANAPHDDSVLIICECTGVNCSAPVSVTYGRYEQVRQSPTTFVMKPDHVLPEVERVVEQTADYVVVEKLGERL